jgi:hypothetical protein
MHALTLSRRRLLQLIAAGAGAAAAARLGDASAAARGWPVQLHVHALSAHRMDRVFSAADNAAQAIGEEIWWTEHHHAWDHSEPGAPAEWSIPRVIDGYMQHIEVVRHSGVSVPLTSQPRLSWAADGPGEVELFFLDGRMVVNALAGADLPGEHRVTDNLLVAIRPLGCDLTNVRIRFGVTREESYQAYSDALPAGQYAALEWRQDSPPVPHMTVYLPQAKLPPRELATAEEFRAWVTSEGGLINWAHPFFKDDYPAAERLRGVADDILAVDAYGSTTIEHYRMRGGADSDLHLELWDILVAAGLPLYMIGVSDSHHPDAFANKGISWTIRQTRPDRATRISGLRNGHIYFGQIHRSAPMFDYHIAGVRMGQTGTPDWTRGVRVRVPAGDEARLTQFDENGYLGRRVPIDQLSERASWARLELFRAGKPRWFGQWCRLNAT